MKTNQNDRKSQFRIPKLLATALFTATTLSAPLLAVRAQATEAQAHHSNPRSSEMNLAGQYEMKIQIGSKLFVDLMELKSTGGKISPIFFHGPIEGSITVVNVFTAPLKGKGQCHPWMFSCYFDFEITAHEQGKDFLVRYSAKLTSENLQNVLAGQHAILVGEARLENGELLGEFVATQKP